VVTVVPVLPPRLLVHQLFALVEAVEVILILLVQVVPVVVVLVQQMATQPTELLTQAVGVVALTVQVVGLMLPPALEVQELLFLKSHLGQHQHSLWALPKQTVAMVKQSETTQSTQ
jgi:hypothetical protein